MRSVLGRDRVRSWGVSFLFAAVVAGSMMSANSAAAYCDEYWVCLDSCEAEYQNCLSYCDPEDYECQYYCEREASWCSQGCRLICPEE